jgi:hypothetical protein
MCALEELRLIAEERIYDVAAGGEKKRWKWGGTSIVAFPVVYESTDVNTEAKYYNYSRPSSMSILRQTSWTMWFCSEGNSRDGRQAGLEKRVM